MADRDDGEANDGDNSLDALVHDLRTPLSAMRTAAEMIGREPLTETQRTALRILTEATDVLIAMTGTLLGADAAPAGAPPADLHRLITTAADLFEVEIGRKGLTLERRLAPHLERRRLAEPLALFRAVAVLLDNATKYTPSGGISLRAELSDVSGRPAVVVDVADTGTGIAAEDWAALFEPYRRGSTAGAVAGTGLGLWNARRLAEAAGGTLELVASAAQGSTFRLAMPLVPLDQGTGPAPDAGAEVAASAREPHPASTEPVRRLLVIDDNATNRRLLGALVAAFGFEAELVADGVTGVASVEAEDYAAVLLDLHMPEMDGFATLDALRALPRGGSLPVIAVTAAVEPSARRLRSLGFDAVVTKPIDPESLRRTLESAIAKAIPDS